jgi:hypothetical protein
MINIIICILNIIIFIIIKSISIKNIIICDINIMIFIIINIKNTIIFIIFIIINIIHIIINKFVENIINIETNNWFDLRGKIKNYYYYCYYHYQIFLKKQLLLPSTKNIIFFFKIEKYKNLDGQVKYYY